MKHKKILFVHIPKTAGTSFRIAAQEYFGLENTFFDYGHQVPDTSKEIENYFYKQKDAYALAIQLDKKKHAFLGGHFRVEKYMKIFDTLDVVTFLRDPVEQVLSHYQHFKRDLNYKGDLLTFINEPRFCNLQSRMLEHKPLELYGFVGITEKYDRSIELFNNYYGCDLKILKSNISEEKGSQKITPTQDVIDMIHKKNHLDILLYQKALLLFELREQLYIKNRPYMHIYIQKQEDGHIGGCALLKDSVEKASINILLDDQVLTTVDAKRYKPALLIHGLPRKGFVGFDYKNNEFQVENLRVVPSY